MQWRCFLFWTRGMGMKMAKAPFFYKKKLCLPHFLFAHERYREGSYVEKNTWDHRCKETQWPTVSAMTMVGVTIHLHSIPVKNWCPSPFTHEETEAWSNRAGTKAIQVGYGVAGRGPNSHPLWNPSHAPQLPPPLFLHFLCPKLHYVLIISFNIHNSLVKMVCLCALKIT